MKRHYKRENNASSSGYGIGLNGLYEDDDRGGHYYDKSTPKNWERNYGTKGYDCERPDPSPSRNQGYSRGRSSHASQQWNGGNRGQGRRGGHPPGLKGREIGLYYRNMSLKKKGNQKPEPEDVATVSIGARKERQISHLLGLQTNQQSNSVSHTSEGAHSSSDDGYRSNPMNSLVTQQSSSLAVHPLQGKEVNCEDNNPCDNKRGMSNISCKVEMTVDNKCKYLPAPVIPQLDRHTSDSKPSTSAAKFALEDYIPLEPRPVVKGGVDADSDWRLDCKALLKRENLQRSVAPAVVDLTMEVAEQYSHVKDSLFKRKFLQSVMGSIESNLEEALAQGSSLVQNPQLDADLKSKFLHKQQHSQRYQAMLEFRKKLPAFQRRQFLLNMIEENQVVVIAGETGCGKTTQLAQFILDDYIMRNVGSTCHIVCTQPRRISATSVAQRVADERDEKLGAESVGYQIRLERKIPRKQGSILFCTTGVMLQWMLTNPGLIDISHLILDEIHERDVTSDFLITLLKSVIVKRPDLKVILMSATLNADQFSNYYGGCPFINIPGFTFPVKEYYLEDVLQMTGFEFPPPKFNKQKPKVWHKFKKGFQDELKRNNDFEEYVLPHVRHLQSTGMFRKSVINNLMKPESEDICLDLIAELIKTICTSQKTGAILVFLPGWDQIAKLNTLMERSHLFSSSKFKIIPLHSMMPTATQHSIFERPPSGVRKIIIATNIAETSITIDDVVFVINCGKTKMKNFDLEKNIATLKPEWVSLANAKQRKGRAGRTQEGVCYHLYTRGREMTFAHYPLPEMLRTRLEQVILQIKILQIGFATPFLKKVMDPPDPRAVDISLKMLRTLNALDGNENLTPLGYHLAKLPMEPQTGKMILMAAIFSCVDPVLSVAAGLNFKDPFVLPLGKENQVREMKLRLAKGSKSDHLVLAEALWRWEESRDRGDQWQFCRDYFLSNNTLQLLSEMKTQLAGYLHEMNFLNSSNPRDYEANRNSTNINLVKAVICSGLYPNVARVRVKQRGNKKPLVLLRTPEDGRVQLHIRSVNEKETQFESQFLMYHMKLKSSGIYLHDTTMIHPLPLLFFGEGVDFRVTNNQELIYVNEHIFFKCQESTAKIVKLLRTKLDWILENKISHPGTIDWGKDSEEAVILREIIGIITTEHAQEVINIDVSDSE